MQIPYEIVTDLDLEKNGVIYRTNKRPFYRDTAYLEHKDFIMFKFELIKYLKKKPIPDDRVLPCECLENGTWSMHKEEKLIEARKTRYEKQKELDYQVWLRKEVKRLRIE